MDISTVRCPSWRRRKTVLEKSVFLVIFILLLTTFILFFVITRIYSTDSSKCRSPVCIKSSSIILNRMNVSVNPCDNFYEFACGKMLKEKIVPLNEIEINIEKEIMNTVEMEIIELLDNSQNETAAFGKAQQFFKACMNESQIRRRGFEPLHRIFKLIGGWPILEGDKWNEQTFDLIEVLMKLRQTGLYRNYLIFIDVANGFIEPARTENMPENQGGKFLTSEDYRALGELIANYIEIMGGDKNSQSVQNDILDLLKFYKSFMELPGIDGTIVQVSVAEIQEKYRNIRWLDLIKIAVSPVQVYNDTKLTIRMPNAMEIFYRLLEQTPKRTIANYILWKVLEVTLDMLPNDLLEAKLLHQRIVAGIYDQPLRWQTCVRKIKKYFALTILSLYKKKYFNEENLKEIKEITNNIQAAIIEITQSAYFMHNLTFLLNITMEADIPEEPFLNGSAIDNLFSDIEINESAYFESEIYLRRKIITTKINVHSFAASYLEHTLVIYYNYMHPMLVALSPFLFRNLFFTKGRPTSMNYASVGYMVGSMIAFRANEILESKLVANDKSAYEYNQQHKCFKEQFKTFKYWDSTDNKFTFNYDAKKHENDNLAIQIAYTAYNKWTNQHKEGDFQLYGIPYSSRQLFWINYAQNLCSKTRKQPSISHIKFTKWTVIGPLRISKEFNRDFQCPLGSYMNLKHNCNCTTILC